MQGRKHLADIRACKPCFYTSIWQGGLITQSLTWLAVIKSELRSQCLYADTSLEWKSEPEAIPVVSAWWNCSHQLGVSCPPWPEKLRLMNWGPQGKEHQPGRKSSNHRGCSADLLRVQSSLLSEKVDWMLFIYITTLPDKFFWRLAGWEPDTAWVIVWSCCAIGMD